MIRPVTPYQTEALYGLDATRQIERQNAALLAPHVLMERAGLAVAQLSRALQPHAKSIWVACGTGNNGGDGLVAATHLHRWARSTGNGISVVATHGSADAAFSKALPRDAHNALANAREAGVTLQLAPPEHFDMGIDALLGMGAVGPVSGAMAHALALLRGTTSPVLCVDLPSGLHAETGVLQPLPHAHANGTKPSAGPRHTLSLLTLKPGLFTRDGRDAAGDVWFDDLLAEPLPGLSPMAWLYGEAPHVTAPHRPHASHKGSFGDVLIVGGQVITHNGEGMTGAAVLAATAALQAGAGRVFVSLLGDSLAAATRHEPLAPELMFRTTQRVFESDLPERAAVVCGCGGGESVKAVLPALLKRTPRLVLDADALNAVATEPDLQALLAQRAQRRQTTVLTPHPLEAARLLQATTEAVMQDRLASAQRLAERFGAICVLKGSGSVLAEPGKTPWINPTGNARLATAGTGDVLAGMIGAAIAAPGIKSVDDSRMRVAAAVYQHGALADQWGLHDREQHAPCASATLTAGRLARRVRPFA